MIITTSKGKFKPDCVEKFISLGKILVEKSNQEEGCISYRLCQDVDDPTVLTFVEIWKDQESIDFHFATSYFTSIVPQFDDMLEKPMDCNKYAIV